MKTWILLWSLLFTALGATAADPLTEALQRGLLAEDANKDLTAAATAYREAIELGDRQRTMVATALFRLAEAERALGRTNEALSGYRRLMREYPEATNLTTLAERRLTEQNAGSGRQTATIRADLALMKDLLRGYREERQRLTALTNDVLALAFALKALHSTPALEGLIQKINEAEVELEALKLRYRLNHPHRQSAEAKIAELRRQLAAENAVILGRLEAREAEFGVLIGKQEDAVARFPDASGTSSVGPEKLLLDEIALAEQQLEIVKRRHDVGRADTEEVLKASRDVLALKRQLAAMQSRPKDIVDLPASASATAPDEESLEIDRLKRLLTNSPDLLNAPQGPENETPLQTAARLDQARVVEYLLKAGAEINSLGGKGVTALYGAAEAGHKRMVEILLRAGADVNAAGVPKLTPLLIAVARERAQVVQTLLDAGASPGTQSGSTPVPTRQQSYDVVSPLGLAVLLKNPPLVEAMVRRGAGLNSPAYRANVPLQIAVSRGDWETAALLLKLGANPEGNRVAPFPIQSAVQQQSSPVTTEFLDQWVAHGGRWDVLDSGGNSLLHLAVSAQSVPAVEWLLRHQASPNLANAEGTTPMMMAVWRRMQAKDGGPTASADRIVAALIAAGADLNRTTRYTDDARPGEAVGGPGTPPNGIPLSWGAVSKESPLFAQLVSAGADPNARNSRGMPLLWFMAASLRSDMDPGVRAGTLTNARTLLTAGANPDLGHNGTTPLRVAVDSSPEMVDLLLEFKADPNRRDDQGRTPLERVTDPLAQGHGGLPPEAQERIVRALRAAGAREDAPDFETIRLVRPSSRFSQVVFRRSGTNDANHFTLLEALAVHYRVIASPGIPNVQLQNRPGSVGLSTVPALAFPDWKRVVIRRPDADRARWTEIPVDVEVMFAPGGCDKDVSLRWGDVIELPERDHAISETWPGIPSEAIPAWKRCLARDVTVHVQGRPSVVTLVLPGIALGPQSSREVRFTLFGGLSASGLLRASSDASRVLLRRKEPATGVVTEDTVDCREPQGEGARVWLQNGDEILVPDL